MQGRRINEGRIMVGSRGVIVQKPASEELLVILYLLGWVEVGSRAELRPAEAHFGSLVCLFIATVEDGFCVQLLGQ
jgi:hypothetical protein